MGLPYRSGLCGSAGATAGMASLAACSTWSGAIRWMGERRVKGAQAGSKAGRRLESLPHKNGRRPGGLPHKNSLTYNRREMLFAGSMLERFGRKPQVCALLGRVRIAAPRGIGKNQALARAFRRAVSLDL